MPAKLLHPLRFFAPSSLHPVARCLPMRLRSLSPPPTATAYPILSRAFPFKLKYRFVGDMGARRFSTRPFRAQPGTDATPSGAEIKASKSLIDDEAELDDWVSDLTRQSRNEGNADSGWGRNRGGTGTGVGRGGDVSNRGRDTGFKRPRDGGDSRRVRGDDEWNSRAKLSNYGTKPQFGSDRKNDRRGQQLGDLPSPRGSWGNESNPRRRPRFGSDDLDDNEDDSDDDEEDEDDEEDDEVYERPRDGGDSRHGRGSAVLNSRAKVSNFRTKPQFGSDRKNERRGQQLGDFKSSPRASWGNGSNQGRRPRFGSDDLDDEDDEEDEVYKNPKKGGLRGVNSGPMSRGGRDSNRIGRVSGGLGTNEERDSRRGVPFRVSARDEGGVGREELLTNFKDLVSEDSTADDDDDDDVDDDDIGEELKTDNSLPRARSNSVPHSESYLSESRFDQCSISPLSLKGIKDAGYEKMTVVQEATLPVILKGKDVLAKARTGTGKTVAFLLPSIEVIVKSTPAGRDQRHPPIVVLVICPTRELASQAAAEAHKLLKYHPSIGVQVVIGGTRLAVEQKRMQANPCQILVATPGRLKDHIENTAGFATRLMGVNVLVLDEADQLLDMGFRKDIESIIAAVPKQRQTLLFSATVAAEVRQICHIALKRDHEFINTVEEGSEETHSQVKQMHMIAPLDKQFPLIYSLLKEHISDDVDYKVLVFCTTAMVTRMLADLLGELNLNVREIHSRKPQSYRTRVSDEFRTSKGLILVTSDVSARGVDYPDVTLVIQVGLPSDRKQYIHRLGRTGRKGKEGQGILLLAPWEEFFLSTIKDLPITKAPVPLVDPDMRKKVARALSQVEMKNKEAAYQAWLGYYNSNKSVGRDKSRLVELANDFSRSMGLDNPPAIPKLVLGKMGLRNVPGLRSK